MLHNNFSYRRYQMKNIFTILMVLLAVANSGPKKKPYQDGYLGKRELLKDTFTPPTLESPNPLSATQQPEIFNQSETPNNQIFEQTIDNELDDQLKIQNPSNTISNELDIQRETQPKTSTILNSISNELDMMKERNITDGMDSNRTILRQCVHEAPSFFNSFFNCYH